ncbi:MAG: hypothetical protein WC412_06010, partial [Candidatus Omnitrophota bacterium]
MKQKSSRNWQSNKDTLCPGLSLKKSPKIFFGIFCFLFCLFVFSQNTFAQQWGTNPAKSRGTTTVSQNGSGGSITTGAQQDKPQTAPAASATSLTASSSSLTLSGLASGAASAAARVASAYVAPATTLYKAATSPATLSAAQKAASAAASYLQKLPAYTPPPTHLPAAAIPAASGPAPTPSYTASAKPSPSIQAAPKPFTYDNFKGINSYIPRSNSITQPYKLPVISANSALKPITPVFIQPNKITALNSGLPNTYTAIKPIKPVFVKMEPIFSKITQPVLLKPQTIKFSAIKPLNMLLDTKLTKITQIPVTMPKLNPAFNSIKPLAFTKISQPEPIKIALGQLNPAFNNNLKPVFNPIKNPIIIPITQPALIKPQWVKLDTYANLAMTKPVLPKLEAIPALKLSEALKTVFNPIKPIPPVMLPIDSKLIKTGIPTLLPIQKPVFINFASPKPAFTVIKQPEPIKTALGKLNPYFMKEQTVFTPIKPNFAPIAQDLTIIKPQIAKLAQLNQPMKPEFMKIAQLSPTLTQPVLIKPNFISMGEIKPLNISLNKNMTRIPEIIAA